MISSSVWTQPLWGQSCLPADRSSSERTLGPGQAHCSVSSEHALCVSYSSVTVLEHHDPGNLQKEGFIVAHSSRGRVHHGWEAGQANGGVSAEQETEGSHPHPHSGSRVKWKWGEAVHPQSPPHSCTSTHVLTEGSITCRQHPPPPPRDQVFSH